MGMNLSIVRVVGADPENGVRTEDWRDWDSTRYVGDREFAEYLMTENHVDCPEDTPGRYGDAAMGLFRPKDFDAARAWIAAHAEAQGNKIRLIHGLHTLLADRDLWFYASY